MGKPIGLVLAGGAGRRLGREKATLRHGGRTLATRAARALAPLCAGVLISIPPGGSNPAPGFAVVEDAPPGGRGPLAGIDGAFAVTGDADLLVLACDYPRVETALLAALVEAAGEAPLALISTEDGRDHPLVALWRRSLAERVRGAIEGGAYRVLDLVASVDARRVAADGSALLNLNRPDDLAALGEAD